MQNMAAGLAAEDPIFVLQADHINVVEVQKFGCVLIRLDVVLGKRPSHPSGIVIPLLGIVHWQRH